MHCQETAPFAREMTHSRRHKGYVRELPSCEGGPTLSGVRLWHLLSPILAPPFILTRTSTFFVLNSINSAPMQLVE